MADSKKKRKVDPGNDQSQTKPKIEKLNQNHTPNNTTHQDEVPMVDLAKLSQLAYKEWKNGQGKDMTDHQYFEDLVTKGEYSIVSQSWEGGGKSSFRKGGESYVPQWTVFKRSNLIVIAVKGTDFEVLNDLMVDLQSIVGGQYPTKMVEALTEAVKAQQTAGFKVMITGHSLGGYAAEIMSTKLDIAGAGFCAPGPNFIGPGGSDHDGEHKHPGFRCINAQHDFIGNLMPGVFEHLQYTVYGESEILSSRIPIGKSHALVAMVDFLEGCTSKITNYNVYEYTSYGFSTCFQYTLSANTQSPTQSK